MAQFQKCLKLSDLPVGEKKMVMVSGQDVLVCNVDGKVSAISNSCAHQGGPLSEGTMSGKIVTCPWHHWKFDVTTGDCTVVVGMDVNSYPTKVEGDDILVEV